MVMMMRNVGRFSPPTELFHQGEAELAERHYDEGINLLNRAVDEGNIAAAFRLGEIYEHGLDGVIAPNFELAIEYFQRAATMVVNNGQTIDELIAQSTPEQLFRLAEAFASGRRERHGQPAVQKNYDYAFRFYRAAAERDYVAAYLPLAHHFREGKGVQQNIQQARLYYDRAYAALPDTIAGLITKGEFHEHGWGRRESVAEACNFYDRAFQAGDIKVGLDLGKIYEEGKKDVQRNRTRAEEYYAGVRRRYEQLGTADAYIELADFYMHGTGGVVRNFQQAEIYYQQAAALGRRIAYYLGLLNYNFGNFQQAQFLLEQAVLEGNNVANLHLGQMYGRGDGVETNAATALWLLEYSGVASSFELGELCRTGTAPQLYLPRFEQDDQRAFTYYGRVEAENDDDNVVKAWLYLGNYYDQGRVVEQSYHNARRFYERAVASGDEDALFRLGYYYEFGYGGIRHLRMAFMCYQLAITNGNPDASQRLGGLYEIGDASLPQDFQQAILFYRKAIEQQQASAFNSLGWLYCVGKGVRQDHRESFRLFTQAEQRGCPDALYSLCLSYLHGYGVPADRQTAARYAEQFIRILENQALPNQALLNQTLLNLSNFYRYGVRADRDPIFADLCVTASSGEAEARAQVIANIRARVAPPPVVSISLLSETARRQQGRANLHLLDEASLVDIIISLQQDLASEEIAKQRFTALLRAKNNFVNQSCDQKEAEIRQGRENFQHRIAALQAEKLQLQQLLQAAAPQPNLREELQHLEPGMRAVMQQLHQRLVNQQPANMELGAQHQHRIRMIDDEINYLTAQVIAQNDPQLMTPIEFEFYKKRHLLEEQEHITSNPLLLGFYASMQASLSGIVVLYKGLATGRLQGVETRFEGILNKICVGGEYLGCIIPGAGILAKLLTDVARYFHGRNRNERNQMASDNIFNITLMERVAEAVARKLTYCYEEQLLNLADYDTSCTVGQAATLPIISWFLDPTRNRKRSDGHVLKEDETIKKFVHLVQEFKLKNEGSMKREKELLKKSIKVRSTGKNHIWTMHEFFTGPGFKTTDKRYFCSGINNPRLYGWRLSTVQEIEQFIPRPYPSLSIYSELYTKLREYQGEYYELKYKALLKKYNKFAPLKS